MGPKNAYKDMLDNVVSPITCVSMNHQNQLEQMTNWDMFATLVHFIAARRPPRSRRHLRAGEGFGFSIRPPIPFSCF
jgi:hypothetical protein